jgi:hypothetical protein
MDRLHVYTLPVGQPGSRIPSPLLILTMMLMMEQVCAEICARKRLPARKSALLGMTCLSACQAAEMQLLLITYSHFIVRKARAGAKRSMDGRVPLSPGEENRNGEI